MDEPEHRPVGRTQDRKVDAEMQHVLPDHCLQVPGLPKVIFDSSPDDTATPTMYKWTFAHSGDEVDRLGRGGQHLNEHVLDFRLVGRRSRPGENPLPPKVSA